MSLFLDSASVEDVTRASALGFVRGITTNPSLMRRVADDPLCHLEQLLKIADVPEIFYQPTGAHGPLREEAERAWKLDRDRVVLKLPATLVGAALAAAMARQGAKVSLTAVQAPHGMLVAESIGCIAVIPYLDRALRDIRATTSLIQSLARVRRGKTRILAASVKSVGQVMHAFDDGADAVTVPRAVLEELLTHPASIEAEHAFSEEYRSR